MAVTVALWEELFVDHSHPATLGFVSSAIAAAIVFFGTGYLLLVEAGDDSRCVRMNGTDRLPGVRFPQEVPCGRDGVACDLGRPGRL